MSTETTTYAKFLPLKSKTSAQLMTQIGFGDCSNHDLPVRNLHFSVQCDSFEDFLSCLNLIESYNEFDAYDIKEHLVSYLNEKRYWNEKNPNNGNDLFTFIVGRESSPVFYVKFSSYLNPKVIISQSGEKYNYEPYTNEMFKTNMKILSQLIKADEFSIEEGHSLVARFWFD